MANHDDVKTKKSMTSRDISAVFEELNKSHFKEQLLFKYSNHEDNKRAWGPHVWEIIYNGEDCCQGFWSRGKTFRICWLNSSRHWEIRHGGGGDFSWWVAAVVINEIAVRFDGIISDEEKGKQGKYKECGDYLEAVCECIENKSERAKVIWQRQKDFVPPMFYVGGEE